MLRPKEQNNIQRIQDLRSKPLTWAWTRTVSNPAESNRAHVLTRPACWARGKNTISSICLLVYRYVMRKSSKQIQFSLNPPQGFLRWC